MASLGVISEKLVEGDEIRVVSPARSMALISEECQKISISALEKMGLKVSFSEHVSEKDDFVSSSILSRVSDLHDAFSDKTVKAILTTIGGFNSNQLLDYLDYDLIKSNPKILCGYSDITAIANAITTKTGLVTYSGPHFSTFGMIKGNGYTEEYFKKCLMQSSPFDITPCQQWSNDRWWEDQEKRNFNTNEGFVVLNEGKTEGTIIGGNLCTFNLLHGTQYMPFLENTILFVEDCVEAKHTFAPNFDRDLQSIIHQPGFEKVKGILIGRFESTSGMTLDLLKKIVSTKKELDNIPVIVNVDFGHTDPKFTFPIGGKTDIAADKNSATIRITKH